MKVRNILLGIVCMVLSGTLNSWATEHPSYHIKARLDNERKEIIAGQYVTFVNNSNQDIFEAYFHIFPNRAFTQAEKNLFLRYAGYFKINPYPDGFDSGKIDFVSILWQEEKLGFSIEGEDRTLLKVRLPFGLKPGESLKLFMNYSVQIPHAYGRFGWHQNIVTLSRWYPILCVLNEAGWHKYPAYLFHRPFFSDAAHYRVELQIPKDLTLISTGVVEEEEKLDEKTKRILLKTDQPVRDFSMALGPDYQLKEDSWQGIKIKSFYLPKGEKKALAAIQDVKDVMTFYTKKFGPYPYSQFSIAPVYLGYGGEQMSNLIYIDTRVYALPEFLRRYFDFLISHETGHQWFYNLVGNDEYAQMWLDEGFNTYFNLQYLEDKYGIDAEVIDWPEWLKPYRWLFPKLTFRKTREYRYQLSVRTKSDYPLVSDLASFSEPSSIFTIAYGKGARVLEMLEYVLGKDKFDQVFKRIFDEYRHKNFSVEDFKRICEDVAEEDLSWFFSQWVTSAGRLDYAVKRVKGRDVTLKNLADITVPVEVRASFADGSQDSFVWDGKTGEETFRLKSTSILKRIVLDPDKKILDYDRTNNHWPRKIETHFVPIFWGLYDLPVFLPDDSYNVVIGPELNRGLGFKVAIQKPYEHLLYLATDYEFGEALRHTRGGYQMKNLFGSQTTLGLEVSDTTDFDQGEDDVVGGKLFLRKELWPAQYGLAEINDHISLYVLRNHGLSDRLDSSSFLEDARNIDYSRREEAIFGTTLSINRSGPYPDPVDGYKCNLTIENAGHFWGGTQYFNRVAVDAAGYKTVFGKNVLAGRIKYGGGYPNDKELFRIGGINGLRGYARKTQRGANALMGSLEFRFPIKTDLNWYFLDGVLGIKAVKGVAFFDAGHSWYKHFSETTLKKDAGLGLRVTVSFGSFLEEAIVRLDAAQAINDSSEDARFWFGMSHAF